MDKEDPNLTELTRFVLSLTLLTIPIIIIGAFTGNITVAPPTASADVFTRSLFIAVMDYIIIVVAIVTIHLIGNLILKRKILSF